MKFLQPSLAYLKAMFFRPLTAFSFLLLAATASATELPDWAIGPFTRQENAQPVIRPNEESKFNDPLRGGDVSWEFLHTFNPAAVLKDGKICVLYRAEDNSGEMRIGGHTSRIGLATSEDGLVFERRSAPVFHPAEDSQKPFEWEGGCEDPRIATAPDGSYVMTYTQYNGKTVRLGIAVSKDLEHWEKLGSAFRGTKYENLNTKSASIVHEIKDGKLVATQIGGKYWMYFGESEVNIAISEDLKSWSPVEAPEGGLLAVMRTRQGHFDSALTEVGPQLVKTDAGILLIYNGKNSTNDDRDKELAPGVYTCGQALFDAELPTRLIKRMDKPFFQPELDWEKSGQYSAGTTFAEGLVLKDERWFLYYGCADSFVGVAIAPKSAH
ncbi:hypothetical protein JIN85_02215 [Luteolibacter pohnpeiensis]|uniref:Pesticidal protein Cry15Aa n=1 Tax=Luteolibacter pohnpeiensis TaxID=454153 RepID=A0A934VV61_9BACT|nr:glycoside hydrolase family 130 protein [Luteolibacter pohnpeiensis]MBK1881209.1 hypothetical protein [Luteolibacter pohnpeiensis]